MRRLVQLATVLLFAAALLTPIAEYFDRWDSAGLANDTEFAIFAFVLTLTFVLVVCALVAEVALRFALLLAWLFQPAYDDPLAPFTSAHPIFGEPPWAVPLRI